MTAANFCPRGYSEADGKLMAISQYSALFAVIGPTYGGDGRTTFPRPDLRSRSPVVIGQGAGLNPVSPGQWRGAESVKLTVANMASHNHAFNVVNENRTSAVTAGSPVTLNDGVVGESGGNTPVGTIPPQLGMRYCVAIQGVFPPRD